MYSRRRPGTKNPNYRSYWPSFTRNHSKKQKLGNFPKIELFSNSFLGERCFHIWARAAFTLYLSRTGGWLGIRVVYYLDSTKPGTFCFVIGYQYWLTHRELEWTAEMLWSAPLFRNHSRNFLHPAARFTQWIRWWACLIYLLVWNQRRSSDQYFSPTALHHCPRRTLTGQSIFLILLHCWSS